MNMFFGKRVVREYNVLLMTLIKVNNDKNMRREDTKEKFNSWQVVLPHLLGLYKATKA